MSNTIQVDFSSNLFIIIIRNNNAFSAPPSVFSKIIECFSPQSIPRWDNYIFILEHSWALTAAHEKTFLLFGRPWKLLSEDNKYRVSLELKLL